MEVNKSKEGSGPQVTRGSDVAVHYTGKLENGE